MVTMCFEQVEPASYEGTSPAECAKALADAGADVVGVNCLNGPEQQLRIALEMRGAVPGTFVASQPVGYATTDEQPDFTAWPNFPYELDPMQVSRKAMAEFARKADEAGIDYIGSCCGSVHDHVRAMAKVLGKVPTAEREWRSRTGKPMSGYEYREHTETEV
jgi:betaine-homocysteine S-methyltransferase